ncbi:hypothetical protein Pelo_7065 [Pelomyxa schiedti]|nr:hypothetical protein Pelo_7065 [Pelomyxa schiedti]
MMENSTDSKADFSRTWPLLLADWDIGLNPKPFRNCSSLTWVDNRNDGAQLNNTAGSRCGWDGILWLDLASLPPASSLLHPPVCCQYPHQHAGSGCTLIVSRSTLLLPPTPYTRLRDKERRVN